MKDPIELLQERRLAAVVQAPERQALIARAIAAARGGVQLLALPVTIPHVAEIAAEITDRTEAVVALADVLEPEHLNVAMAAGVELVLSPVWDEELVTACRHRGIAIVPSISTPTELLVASRGHEGPIAIYPAGAIGGTEFVSRMSLLRPAVPLVAAGAIGPDKGAQYLEAGASAIVIDTGLFPGDDDPASLEIISVRAEALVELCAEAVPGVRASRP